MLNRIIYLKRNVFLLPLLVFFPMVFCAGIVAFLIHYLGFKSWDKIFLTVMFVIELLYFVRIYLENKKFIVFTDNEIQVCKKSKNDPNVLHSFKIEAIKSIVCNDKRKEIKFLYHNCPERTFLRFKYSNLIGEEVYFNVKAELCRYYPTKTVACRDEYVEKYITEGVIPEYVQAKQFSEKCKVIIILFFEFIFAVIPIGLTILSVLWSMCGFWIVILKGVILLLNLFQG